ncbi:hypothetical protein BC831DRAFT_459759 [Entophlyctis helioformis]|nr:hypothetical protein BC831DRAFT_459759 [Entophlyctis helioformis]
MPANLHSDGACILVMFGLVRGAGGAGGFRSSLLGESELNSRNSCCTGPAPSMAMSASLSVPACSASACPSSLPSLLLALGLSS